MKGKVCIVTGANSGLGKATSVGLAKEGALVVMVCRDSEKSRIAKEEIKEKAETDSVDLMTADLSSQQSVRDLAKEFRTKYKSLDVLINNAAIVLSHLEHSSDGIEMQFATNYLSQFLLTNLLTDMLKSSGGRIINISSSNLDVEFHDKCKGSDSQIVINSGRSEAGMSATVILCVNSEYEFENEELSFTFNVILYSPGEVKVCSIIFPSEILLFGRYQ